MTALSTLALALGSSFCAGINLYATVFVLGALSRFTGYDLPVGLKVLESDWVLWPALAMYIIEFVADKVPAVDTAWDAIHSFLRIPAGAVLAAHAFGQVPGEFEVLAGLIGGTLAATSHATKASGRVAIHSTGLSVVAPVVSVLEDVAVVGTMAMVTAHPIIALFLLAVMVTAAYFILRTFWRLMRRVLGAIRSFFNSFSPEPTATA